MHPLYQALLARVCPVPCFVVHGVAAERAGTAAAARAVGLHRRFVVS